MEHVALVLSGGGARGAYQAGVLSAVARICSKLRIEDPFQIYTGVSAGSINVCMMTGQPGNFIDGVHRIVDLWSQLESDQVFYADLMALSRGGLQWMQELSLGGSKKERSLRSLLSTHPLNNLISELCDFTEIDRKIESGILRGVCVSAMDYHNVSTVNFFQAHPSVKLWKKGMHQGVRTKLATHHVMASSAIPLLFPPIKIGNDFYGDGCIRNQSPCGPGIYMGASRILAVGVRSSQSTIESYHHKKIKTFPTVSTIANALMNAVMMDGLESDIHRMESLNKGYRMLNPQDREKAGMKVVENLWISPSVDFAELAADRGGELPRIIRYLLKGPGSLGESAEMLSYLLFTPSYCRQLIDIGFKDGMNKKNEIENLLIVNAKGSVKHQRSGVA